MRDYIVCNDSDLWGKSDANFLPLPGLQKPICKLVFSTFSVYRIYHLFWNKNYKLLVPFIVHNSVWSPQWHLFMLINMLNAFGSSPLPTFFCQKPNKSSPYNFVLLILLMVKQTISLKNLNSSPDRKKMSRTIICVRDNWITRVT